MMKAVVFTCFVASVAANSISDARVPVFLEGVSTGLMTDIKNVTECAAGVRMSLLPFEKSLPVVKQALGKDSIASLKYTLPLLGVGVQELSRAFLACHNAVGTEVEKAGRLLQNPSAAAEVLSKVLLPSVQENLEALATAFAANDMYTAGVYAGRVIGSFFEGRADQKAARQFGFGYNFFNY